MLHTVAGRIAYDSEVREVKTKDGQKKMVAINTVYVWDGEKDSAHIPVKVEAWGEVAHELATYKRGETIQFVGKVKSMKRQSKTSGGDEEPKIRIEMGYKIIKIDPNKWVVRDIGRVIADYAKPEQQDDITE